MGKTIGIDLGTTNSCVAFMENGDPTVISNAEGGRTTPSVIAFTKDGERIVGAAAKRQLVTNSARTVTSIKRDMGTDNRTKIDGKSYTPQELSAIILQKLKTDAEAYLGEDVTDAVITVPAYFSDSQRQATKDAGKIAGLNVLRIINEPTAAAFAYGMDKGGAQKIMVFDLGGGTFDVSVLDINNDVIEVLATAGNNRLGGDDFDSCMASYLVEEFKKKERIDLTRDSVAMSRIREAAEKAKIELSSATMASVNLPFLTSDRNGAKHLELDITRAKFDELTRHLVDATIEPVKQAMNDAGLKVGELNRVLLVGGSTRVPAVQAAVKKFTGKEPSKDINPDECVAMGAALQGGVMVGEVKGLLLLDVTPLSLGIETMGDVFSRIIDRNTTLPVQRSQVFTTAANFQTSVDIHVLQGEREIASCNKTLGRFKLTGIRRAMRGIPQIEVTFSIDANGIVNVSAKDLGNGKFQEITLTQSSNMSSSEIDKAIKDAERYASEDAIRKESIELHNRAEELLYQAKSAQKKLNSSDKERIEGLRKQVKKTMDDKNDTALKAACDELTTAMQAVGRFVDEHDAASEDGAMDADYSSTSGDDEDLT
ncbi:MAG: molecular chaperone DnaK [Clostridiales bacterium]|nr:molecular chaperone DnaK [Clostridiales bacterium]